MHSESSEHFNTHSSKFGVLVVLSGTKALTAVLHIMLRAVPPGAVYGLGRLGQSSESGTIAVVVGRAVVVSRVIGASVVVAASVVETMTERVSETSVPVVDGVRDVVNSPIPVDVTVVSRPDVTMDDGRHGPALTPEIARKKAEAARIESQDIVTSG